MKLITYLIKWSNLIFMPKLVAYGQQMRVLESFHITTNLSKKN